MRGRIGDESHAAPLPPLPNGERSAIAPRREDRRFPTALVLLVALLSAPALALEAPPALEGIGVDARPGAALPLDARFRDETGQEVRLGRAFRGRRPVLLAFAYSRCPMLCGVVLGELADAAAEAPGALREARWLVISIDPREGPDDAREARRRFVRRAGLADPRAAPEFWVGEEEEIRRATDALGYRHRRDPRSGTYAHPAALFAITPDGRLSRVLQGAGFARAELEQAVAAAAAGETGASLGELVLQCFRYTPVLRRFADAVAGALRGGGVLILAAAVGVVAFGARRRRRETRGGER